MRTVLGYVKLNKEILRNKESLRPKVRKAIWKASDPSLGLMTSREEEEMLERLSSQYGEIIEDSVELEYESGCDEEIENILNRAFKEAGYLRWEDLEKTLNG